MIELHTLTKKFDAGWAVVIDDPKQRGLCSAVHGFYLSKLCDGSTTARPQYFATRKEAREAIDRYNEINAGVFRMTGGLH